MSILPHSEPTHESAHLSPYEPFRRPSFYPIHSALFSSKSVYPSQSTSVCLGAVQRFAHTAPGSFLCQRSAAILGAPVPMDMQTGLRTHGSLVLIKTGCLLLVCLRGGGGGGGVCKCGLRAVRGRDAAAFASAGCFRRVCTYRP